MSGRYRLRKEAKKLNVVKQDEVEYIPGLLGITIGGSKVVEVPTRLGFVYVRLRSDLSETIKAYNDKVANVYDLPVLVIRDENSKNHYSIYSKDNGVYENWGSTTYLPRHGAQHSYDPSSPGGDIVWVWDNQFMQFAPIPSGSSGGMNIIIEPGMFYSDRYSRWIYAGNTGTQSFNPYKPTGTSANVNFVYIDFDGNPQIEAGSSFLASVTGTSEIFSYLPAMPLDTEIPICAVRLLSGTSTILWDNIYNLRQFPAGYNLAPLSGQAVFTIEGDVSIGTGSTLIYNHLGRTAHIIGVYVACPVGSGPVGSDMIIDVHKGGTTIFTNQANRPRIVDGSSTGNTTTIDIPNWANGEYLTVDRDAVGSGTAGSDLTVTIVYR